MHKQDGIDVAFPARPESSPELRRALRSFLMGLRLEEDRAHDVILAVGEAAGNAIEHAYNGHGGGVRLRAYVDPQRHLIVEVHDSGRWRLEGDPERGRGLGIMKALVDRVSIESTHAGTNVRLEVSL
jgi:anti-sigma regulatory factor (Ser/Thr protein kinase)